MHRMLIPAMLAIASAAPALDAPLAECALSSAISLIRPELQPGDLFERAQAVVVLRMTAVDDDRHSVELTVTQVCKGTFAPKTVTMTLVGEQPMSAFVNLAGKGTTVTAFIGKSRSPLDILFYAGGEGRWQIGSLASAEDSAHWNWSNDLGQLGDKSLFGTFNGSDERFAEMMADKAAGRMYFPAAPISRFHAEQVLTTCAGPVRGVALYDLDGDGRPDVYACSERGGYLLIRGADGAYVDRTESLGLAGVGSSSVSAADFNADGRADLLLDGVIWQQGADGRFSRTERLPVAPAGTVLSALVLDHDHNGYPDVVLSLRSGGLRLWCNPGAAGGAFIDRTAALGLDQSDCGAGGTGWVMAGDWQGDGRSSLFYAVGGGLLLNPDASGRFAPSGTLGYDFTAGGQASGLTGAGCFAPVWKPGRQDLLFTRDTGFAFAINLNDGKLHDGVQYGNELQLASLGQLPLIAEDLDADGNVDIYIGSRDGKPNMYYMNRGYGSFMVPDRYDPGVFPGTTHHHGAWGLAAGDADGDGANDLLVGGIDGRVSLLLNDCFSRRQAKEHPTAVERTLEGVRIASVRVMGPLGVTGATVTLAAADGRVLGRRDLASNVATGCRSPDTVNLAVREPGTNTITVRWSDGLTRRWSLNMGAGTPRIQSLTAERSEGAKP